MSVTSLLDGSNHLANYVGHSVSRKSFGGLDSRAHEPLRASGHIATDQTGTKFTSWGRIAEE
jgi:hypothetical protein